MNTTWKNLFEACEDLLEQAGQKDKKTLESIVEAVSLKVERAELRSLMEEPYEEGKTILDMDLQAEQVGPWAVMSPMDFARIAMEEILLEHLRKSSEKEKKTRRETPGDFFEGLGRTVQEIEQQCWETPDDDGVMPGEARNRLEEQVDALEELLKKARMKGYELLCTIRAIKNHEEQNGGDMSWLDSTFAEISEDKWTWE